VFVLPPGSQIGPITPAQRQALVAGSLVAGTYEKVVDRESAYEKLNARNGVGTGPRTGGGTAANTGASTAANTAAPSVGDASSGGWMDNLKDAVFGSTGPRGGRHAGLAEKAASSALRSMGTAVGRELIRGVLGSLLGKRR
jgi:uncharacterized protein